jgi:hypothetical protein
VAKDSDMRMLGAVDGYAHALCDVKWQIGYLLNTRIDPRHKRKIAARAAILRPLRDLEVKFAKHHAECLIAYRKTTE